MYFNLKNTQVLAHPAILCNSVYFHLPGTTDELGDDHWVLLEDKQKQFTPSEDQGCQRCPKRSVPFLNSLLHKWINGILLNLKR